VTHAEDLKHSDFKHDMGDFRGSVGSEKPRSYIGLEENAEKSVQSREVPNDYRRWNHEEHTDHTLRGLERPHATRDYMFDSRVYQCSDIAT